MYIYVGNSRFTICMEKYMQVMIITVTLFTLCFMYSTVKLLSPTPVYAHIHTLKGRVQDLSSLYFCDPAQCQT